MRKIILFLVLTTHLFFAYAKKEVNNIKIFLKDGTIVSGKTEDVKENSILPLRALTVDKKNYTLNTIDSFSVNKDIYSILTYHDTSYVARPLFKGDVVAYKIFSGRPVLLIAKTADKEKFMEITEKNKFGMYNYLFKDCLTKDSSVIKKRTNSLNDYVLTNEVVKKLNCNKQQYTIYKSYPKSGFYIGAEGGFGLLKPMIKSNVKTYLSGSKKSPKPGYFAGIAFMGNIYHNYDVLAEFDYSYNKSTYSYEETNTFPTTYTSSYAGTITSKAVNLNINFRYRFLKTKCSPFVLFGIRYSHKLENTDEHTYKNNFNSNSTHASVSLNSAAIGINMGAGVNYDVTKRLTMHLNIGYSYGFGVEGPQGYGIREGLFFTEFGILVRVNKLY